MKENSIKTFGICFSMLVCFVLGAVTVDMDMHGYFVVVLVSMSTYSLLSSIPHLVSTGTKKRFQRWRRSHKKTLYIR